MSHLIPRTRREAKRKVIKHAVIGLLVLTIVCLYVATHASPLYIVPIVLAAAKYFAVVFESASGKFRFKPLRVLIRTLLIAPGVALFFVGLNAFLHGSTVAANGGVDLKTAGAFTMGIGVGAVLLGYFFPVFRLFVHSGDEHLKRAEVAQAQLGRSAIAKISR